MEKNGNGNEKQARLKTLAAQFATLSESARAAIVEKVGAVVTCEGHPLSLRNTICLYMQAQGAPLSMIGGFRQWQRVGRQVRKGEHATGYILVPSERGVSKEDAENGIKQLDTLRFYGVAVFDISQTDQIN